MSNPAVFGVIAQIEQSLQLLRTLLGQRAGPQQPQRVPDQQHYLNQREEQALGEAVYPDMPQQGYPQQPQYPQPAQFQQQPNGYHPQQQFQQPQAPANQAASARLLSQILGGGGN